MKFSEAWLRTWVDPPIDTHALAEQLTNAGLEVDGIEAAAGGFSGVVVGRVLEVMAHPDADKLRVCKVDAGEGEPLQIVCGASNVRTGMHAPVALVGGVLPNGTKMKRAKLRGVESLGMLCSEAELGMAESASGLLALPDDAPVGMPVDEYLALRDSSIDVDLTPNRGDCLSIAGIAREVGVLNRLPVQAPAFDDVPATLGDCFPVRVEAGADCPRYLGRVIRNIDIHAQTPLWMQERLRRGGQRSISPTVDVTNYLLLELGQPMHAFDLDKLDAEIVARRAVPGERLVLLDGSEVEPDDATLVIADRSGPVALAGIMGGERTAVDDATRNLFLECAFFSPDSIAGRARRYGLHTDSSHRFERGVDFELQARAMQRATRLLLDIVGGEPGPVTEAASPANLPSRAPVLLRHERVTRMLGMPVDAGRIEDILARLDMTVEAVDGGWRVTPPSFRFDIAIEADLVEEIARVVGYDAIPDSVPMAHLDIRPAPESAVPVSRLRAALVQRGFQEAITYSFVEPGLLARFDPDSSPVTLANPISADMAVMRTSLWPGLLQALRYNQARQQSRIRLFETGLRFLPGTGGITQQPMVAGIVSGTALVEQWGEAKRTVDFFDIKSDVEALLALGGEPGSCRFEETAHPALHPGQCAAIRRGDEVVGTLGALHPALAAELDVSGSTYLFEIAISALNMGVLPTFAPLSRFPAIRRDLAVIVDEAVSAQAVQDCIGQAASHVLKKLQLFDVYRGEGIDSGRKSLAYGLVLQDSSKTLTDDDVDILIDAVLAALSDQLGGTLRS